MFQAIVAKIAKVAGQKQEQQKLNEGFSKMVEKNKTVNNAKASASVSNAGNDPQEKTQYLATLDFTKAAGIVNVDEMQSPQKYVPHLYINNTGDYEAEIRYNGKTVVLESGWRLKHLAARESCRKLVGKHYTDRLIKPRDDKDPKATAAWNEAVAKAEKGEDKWYKGLVHLVVVITAEGEATFASIETFGANEAYWLEVFKSTRKDETCGVEVEIKSHKPNLTKSKKSGFEYLASWKFSQWKPVELTEDERELIKHAWATQNKQIREYLS